MVEDKKKVVMIVIVVVCLGLAAVIAVKNYGGRGGGGGVAAVGPAPMLCVNPDCGHIFELTREARREQMLAKGRAMRRRGPMAFTCPQCGEESAYQANKCSKCSTVFIRDDTSGDFADRCPGCGYSAIEEKRASEK